MYQKAHFRQSVAMCKASVVLWKEISLCFIVVVNQSAVNPPRLNAMT